MSGSPSKPPNARLYELQRPEKLSKILREDKDDCLSCRLVGASAFIGLGAYVYYSAKQGLKERGHIIAGQSGLGGVKWRLRGIALLSSSFVGMGLYRLVN
ncbi:MAG: hypothetical protein Q9175_001539 [Cornicularia normoerica]